nr:TetR family transcriptional regulator [Sphaerisporangium album]
MTTERHSSPQRHPCAPDAPGPSGTTARPPQERGRRRRAALLAAAVGLLEEGGFTAVTHRAVAGRAGLPLAATTYYFTSRDELVSEAFALLVVRELGEMRARLEPGTPRDPESLAALLATAMGPGAVPGAGRGSPAQAGSRGAGEGDRLRQLGLWELYLQAGRDPALQAIARDWTDGCDALVAQVLDHAGYPSGRASARMIGILLAGLWMEYAVEGRPEAAQEAREILLRALRALSPSAPGRAG